MMLLIALFILLPLAEFSLLIDVGERIGALPTVAIVVLTGVVGASLARAQGLAIWTRLQAELSAGRQPTATLLEGFLVLLAGLVLLLPGFLTDVLGLLCLLPFTRRLLLGWWQRRLALATAAGRVNVRFGGLSRGGEPPIKDAQVIDDGASRDGE